MRSDVHASHFLFLIFGIHQTPVTRDHIKLQSRSVYVLSAKQKLYRTMKYTYYTYKHINKLDIGLMGRGNAESNVNIEFQSFLEYSTVIVH